MWQGSIFHLGTAITSKSSAANLVFVRDSGVVDTVTGGMWTKWINSHHLLQCLSVCGSTCNMRPSWHHVDPKEAAKKTQKEKLTDSTDCCTAPMLSLCLCLVWKFVNHWSKQRGCCWLLGDRKGGKMEPSQRAAYRQGSWTSTAGHLSSPPASADVTVSSVRTSLCAHWPAFLHHKSHQEKMCTLPLLSEDETEDRQILCGYLFITVIY